MSAIGQQRVLAQLEGENEKEKVELVLLQTTEGSASLEVRSLRWGQGIGWYAQKTIILAPTQVKRLARLLRRFSVRSRSKTGGRKILRLPGNRTR